METSIHIGIDLGTTNSLIARFHQGKVEVCKNPVSWKETLPSVVAFKHGKVTTGEKAKEFLEKDPLNVFGAFKRKMGSSEKLKIQSLGKEISPIELSSFVIKELKTFLPAGSDASSAIITIPASFDTVQSNATKEAGFLAGFQNIDLLQEPIAASLAFVNNSPENELKNGYWMVYDLGGGTFDIALVRIEEEEMRVIDHEGDNFLGGKDFDAALIEKIIIPHLESKYKFKNLQSQMKSASGKYNKEWFIFMNRAENLKIELSSKKSAEFEIEITDESGQYVYEVLEIQREQFDELIKKDIEATITMIQNIISRNHLAAAEIQFILMVGGSTYIPYIRNKIKEMTSIQVNTNIDPTNAVVVGAAFYAGSRKPSSKSLSSYSSTQNESNLKITLAYEKSSKDTEAFLIVKFEGILEKLIYRIYREDGGYDSGNKKIESKIQESLPLLKNVYNYFELKVFDQFQNEIKTDCEKIGIVQGQFAIAGQPLPEDISLELDAFEDEGTKLSLLFRKNAVLPIRKIENRLINKTIRKGTDDKFVVNILEGSVNSIPEANKTIGYLAIVGHQITRDLIKGADIELTIEVSESRDLTIKAYIPMLDQEFKQIFRSTERHIPFDKLRKEIEVFKNELNNEMSKAIQIENYEFAGLIRNELSELEKIHLEMQAISDDDVTDKRYQIEDQKRKIAQKIHILTKDQKFKILIDEYFSEKIFTYKTLEESMDKSSEAEYHEITKNEGVIINSQDSKKIKQASEKLRYLRISIHWKSDEYVAYLFSYISTRKEEFTDQKLGEKLLESGEKAIQNKDFVQLRHLVNNLFNLLPNKPDMDQIYRSTGLI